MKTSFFSSLFLAAISLATSACSTNNELTKDLIEQPTKDEEVIISSAMNAYDRGLYSRSREEWISLRDGYPSSYFVPLAQLKIADCYFAAGENVEAVSAYQEFIRLFPAHEASAYAHYRLGESYLKQYRGIKNDQAPLKEAIKTFKEVLESYSSTDYARLAQEQLSSLKKLTVAYELSVAEFYDKQGLDKAAEIRRANAH